MKKKPFNLNKLFTLFKKYREQVLHDGNYLNYTSLVIFGDESGRVDISRGEDNIKITKFHFDNFEHAYEQLTKEIK